MRHLTAGDFNLRTWSGGDNTRYHERVAESGIWELSDLRLATLERRLGFGEKPFLFLPVGGCAYWIFMP